MDLPADLIDLSRYKDIWIRSLSSISKEMEIITSLEALDRGHGTITSLMITNTSTQNVSNQLHVLFDYT